MDEALVILCPKREEIQPGVRLRNLTYFWEILVIDVVDADTVIIRDPHGTGPVPIAYLVTPNYQLL